MQTIITVFQAFGETIGRLWDVSGFANMQLNQLGMILISFVLLYLAIAKKFEPLLLLPIAFGMMMSNLPMGGVIHMEFFSPDYIKELGYADGTLFAVNELISKGGLLDFLYLGVKLGIYPPLIFLGIGAMTDFGPLLANPKSLILGAAAQFGIFLTFLGALFLGFTPDQAASIGIIGGADGPTAIFVTKTLAPELLGAIAVAAYSYMALVPVIQPPIMRALTTKKERNVVMGQLREVSRKERILFPIIVTVIVALIVPDALTLVGMLMLGNLLKESGVAERLVKTASNELMNIITIMLGVSVGATATAETFLRVETLMIIVLGVIAFGFSTASGVLIGKIMYKVTGGKINPLIGSAGVSAVPMAARVSQKVGQQENPNNFLLMHAMGPNVAGVIGSAVAAGILLALLK
ncbi:MAG: carboxybiotin decarboxylase [Clostridiales bacterium]|jgi:oxaloacetate decarboxylase beta subunit|nr:carboxybiotin decarboxylase [Clostridiales bacterium]